MDRRGHRGDGIRRHGGHSAGEDLSNAMEEGVETIVNALHNALRALTQTPWSTLKA